MPLPTSTFSPLNLPFRLPGISLNPFGTKVKLRSSFETQLWEETFPTSQNRGGPFTDVSLLHIAYALIPVFCQASDAEMIGFC